MEGYTNFLWTVLLAAGIRLGGDPIWIAKAVGTLCGAGLIVLTTLLAGKLVPGRGAWTALPALMLAATASVPYYALSGMETLMFSMWLCLALWFELGGAGRWDRTLAALALALASLTRPEGLLFFSVLSVAWVLERACCGERLVEVLQGALLSTLAFSVIYLPYFLWRYTYYGYPLPNTFYAKAGGLAPAAIARGLHYLREGLLILNLPLAVCGLLGLLAAKRRGVSAILLALAAYVVYLVVIGGDDLTGIGPRFLVVVFPWLAVLGLAGLMELAGHRWQPRWSLPAISAFTILALIGGLSVFEATAHHGMVSATNRGLWAAAEWLATHAEPGDLLAVDAAGIMPYHSGLPTIDMLGLNDVHIAHLSVPLMGSGLAGHEKSDPSYVLGQRPVYITSWLDEQGRPLSAGLGRIVGRLEEEYNLAAAVLMRRAEIDEPVWLDLTATAYTGESYSRGYIYGIFRLSERRSLRPQPKADSPGGY